MSHLFRVTDKHAVTDNVPIADGDVAFGNDVDPLVFSVVAKTDFDNAAVRRTAVRDSNDSFFHQMQGKAIVDLSGNRLWRAFSFKPFQVDVREGFFHKAVDQKTKTVSFLEKN